MSQQQQQIQQMQQHHQVVQQSSTQNTQQTFVQQQQTQQTQQSQQLQTRVIREVRQGMQALPGTMMMPVGLPPGASPPVFEQIFRNARFAQGGDAMFEGKVQGNPKPTVSWTRKGQQIFHGPKYQVTHDQNTGIVTLQICAIGPGDEGEYVCTASNEYGEAICTVYIQPEAAYMMQQQRQQQQQLQSKQTFMQNQQMQRTTQQQQQQMQMRQFGQVESFRVDTFEYRILHEVEYRQSLTQKLPGEIEVGHTGPLQGPPQAPQIQQKPRSTKVAEHNNATFIVKIAANPSPRIIWFRNGERLVQSDKYLMTQSAGQVTLVVTDVNANDSGYYTMLAENTSGCTVASAQLAVVPKGSDVNGTIETEIIRSEKIDTFQQQQMEDTGEESGKSLEPKFVRIPPHQAVQEGKLVRFDCRVTGRPYPDVTWFLNGQVVRNDANHKILVNEQGNHSLMITQASLHDAGVITCVAKNKTGEASFQVQLNVLEREQVVAPKFVERFQQGQVREGETVQLHARAVGTPNPQLSWQKDGATISPSANVQIQSDGGASILQILSTSAADAGWYQCTAQNVAGSVSTRARLHVQTTKQPDGPTAPQRPFFPKPTKVIEPEKEPEPEIIYLRHIERAHQQVKGPEEEPPTEAPKFTHFLRDIDVAESKRAHFEARVVPLGDATMQIEWLIDGRPLPASSRATVTYRFGYVALDILNVITEDAGVYTCCATNVIGQAETSANLRVTEKPVIESGTQHPDALQKISYLEDQSKYQRTTSIDEQSNIKPTFVKPLFDLGEIYEGKYAHFEAQLHPVSDPYMRIEWFKDGRPITASSRINVIYNFGYVALTIMHLRQEDTGIYTVRATNKAGECTCQAAMRVITLSSVTGDLGIPEQAQYIKSVEEMEAYRLQMLQKTAQELFEMTTAPVFKTNLKGASCKEGGYAHFEARLEPIGDPSLKVEWLKDGRPIEASSRITTFFNFGYVALTIKALTTRDAGTYTCRAHNAKGEATNVCTLTVISKKDIEIESQYEDTVTKMQYIEDAARRQRTETEESIVKIAPKFLGPLKGTTKIVEGQNAHFEIRLEPQNDPSMRIEWYFNGKVIMDASRIKFYNDFGYVALDISDVRSTDTGTYTVVARNAMGEAQMSATMEVEVRSAIDYSTMHEVTMNKTAAMERRHQEPHYDIEEYTKSKPVFTHPLQDVQPMPEGRNIHLEARLEPMGDPTMKVEWYFNGKPVTVGSRFRTYFDFGYVALDIIGAYATDTGEYTCRAENVLGSAHTSSCIHIIGTGDIETETMHDNAMEQIHYLEGQRGQRQAYEEVDVNQPPAFTKSLKNIETIEGTNIHLEARLQPVGDTSMRVEWFFNDQPLKVGHRFRPAYDFDYVALDLLGVYPIDSGIYTCRATNKLGQAVTSASVRVVAKKDLVYDSDHPDALQKLQYLEDSSRYQRRDQMDEVAVKIKPKFLTQMKDQNLKENMTAHFEAKLEPITDSNLRVEWYKDGRPIAIGSRFRTIHDFGYVALDIRNLVPEDAGVYTCVATNLLGKDEISVTLKCLNSSSIIMESQSESMTAEQLQMLEERRRYERTEITEETTKQAPVFTTSIKNIEILEGQRAHFEARLIPTSDPTMKVEWYCNNKIVKSGSRFTEYNDFGFIALDIMYAYAEDSGTYTCVATNALGQAISSASLVVHTKESIILDSVNQEAMQKISRLESRHQRASAIEEASFQAPMFTSPIKDQHLPENVPLHFEARLIPVGDPDLRVEWFVNGIPLQPANRISTMHDFGYVALDMKYVKPEDSGTYTCRATNKLGQAVCSASLVVTSKQSLLLETQHAEALEKLRYLEDTSRYSKSATEETVITQAPKFVVKLSGLTQLWEGQSAHVEGRLEPYPDPTMKVEWFHNGKPLAVGHRFRTMYDFGFCAMDILSAMATDSGTYEVRATNRLGTASSTIDITVKSKSDFIIDSQHPEAMAKIQRLEQKGTRKATEESVVIEKPNFGRALRNQDKLIEGQAVHMEATLTPVNDPTMKVEWFFNGVPIPSGHRFRTTYDFGFVALDILYAYPEDSGTYMCRATNAAGQAVTSCNITIEATDSMMIETLDEERMRKIRKLEHVSSTVKEELEKEHGKPVFTTPLQSQDQVGEGNRVHLECRLEPVNDPNLKLEWFVNGVEIKTGHRFRTTHDFGYVALDILYAYEEDSGTYLCKATNLKGEAVNSCSVNVSARRSIYMDTQHEAGWEKIQNLEQKSRYDRLEVQDLPSQAPRFTSELRGVTSLGEGQKAHIEGRIEPIHDPSMKIEWYHNGKIIQSAARFHTTFDFGYVAFDLSSVYPEDSGEYICRAYNKMGEARSTINLKIEGTGNIIYESARPEGLEKIRELEDAARTGVQAVEDLRTFQRPVFTQPLQNLDNLNEGETAHFECRLIPVGDPKLKVEWFRNEKPIEPSSRINRTHDFGYVALDIIGVRPDDEGIYMCRAYNDLGEAVTTASIKIRSHANIQLDTHHPEGMRKIQALEERKPVDRSEPEKIYDKPVFTTQLQGPAQVMEGQTAHYECKVVPVGDPNLKFEWYCNGVSLRMGSRFRTTTDFGFVTLDVLQTIPEDSGVYMCKAYNLAGEAVSSCSTRVIGRDSVIGDAAHPQGWEAIRQREAQWNRVPPTPTSPEMAEPPMFTKHLESFDRLQEGGTVSLEAQVQPSHDPYLSIEWFKNGIQLALGTRIRSTFDFGHVLLHVSGLRENDSGIYTCKAVNRVGEAVSTCTLKVHDRDWLIGDSVRPEALQKLAQFDQPRGVHREEAEPVYDLPVFISHLNNVECWEGDTAHFECNVEPSKDPTMKIEWFINGKPMQAASRYAATYDFGFVSLDCTHCYEEDSGIYMCKATNSKGSASTTGTLKCISKANIYLDTQHPQGKAGLEKIEEAERAFFNKSVRPPTEEDVAFQKPYFIRPLEANFTLMENQSLHMEANVEPKKDPNLKIEWFLNGKPLEHGARYKSSYDFGLVTLDLNDCYERDQGIYTCRAYNKVGEAFCTTTVVVGAKGSLIEGTQHPAGDAGLEAIQRMEESLRRSDRKIPDEEGHPPIFTTQFKSLSNIEETEIAHFEAMLTPVGDETMKVEWFYNGEALKASHRFRTVYAFGMVVLEVVGTKVADSGTYTCRATNKWGQAECSCTLEVVDRAHGQPPHFTTHIEDIADAKDGQSGHFECTLIPVGDPNMKVEWFHNGQPLRNATRIKTVCDFGYVVLDVAYLRNHDTGEWVCRASNKYGEDFTKAFIKCTGKGGVITDSLQPGALDKIARLEAGKLGDAGVLSPTGAGEPPKFITQIANIDQLAEGQSAHFEARLKPVGDPNLIVEWYKDGQKLSSKHRYRTFHDFGIVILDILYCYEEDSGVYEARAYNKLGEDKTSATLKCSSKAGLILSPQIPKDMEGGLEKIQKIEDTAWMRRQSEISEKMGIPPKFTIPLNDIDGLKEGENAHFEARLVPTDDPRLKVEWYYNGKPMRHSSRIRHFCDFGFVIMEMSTVYAEDSGEYMCRAYNDYGEAVTKGILKCEGKRNIIFDSQLPKSMQGGMEKIAELEGLMIKSPDDLTSPDSGQPPQFLTQPADVNISENQLTHFECKLIPVGDPALRVEWYHNGRSLRTGTRIKTISDFGYVILEIANCYSRDAGTYTCRAINRHGEASVECKLSISSKSGVILDPQATGHFKGCTESILKLEEQRFKRGDDTQAEDEKPNPPRFITNLDNIIDLPEGQPAHFDCRVEPVGDPTMRIEWFHNGSQLGVGSRVHMMDDFGFVVLDLEWTFARDAGEYVCRATNKWGQATTSATLKIKFKHGIDMNTQLPQGMTAEKLKELERGPLTEKPDVDEQAIPPKFIVPLKDLAIEEGEPARFEADVEPKTDPNLRIEWYFNGKPLQSGHRFRTSFEMGRVVFELLYTYPEDSGEYICRAVNRVGQDATKATLKSKAAQGVIMHSQALKGVKPKDIMTQLEETMRKYNVKEILLTEEDIYDVKKRQPPRFITQIQENTSLQEMIDYKFDCQLTPVGDPNMKVEWFFNGRPLPFKTRFTPIYDFGYVALIMSWLYGEDSGHYLCRATNKYGMDETTAFIKIASRPGVIYDSQIPKGMQSLEKIRELESSWKITPSTEIEEEKVRTKPEILKAPETILVQEGSWARFSMRVAGYPKPRVMWIVNGSTAISGNRFKIWYDGMFHLDIPKTRQYDEGKIEVIARNSLGEAYATCELKVKPRQDDYRAVLKNSPKQHVEGASEQYRKPDWVKKMETLKHKMEEEKTEPSFIQELIPGRVKEMDNHTFTATFAGNPKPEITWLHNDRILHQCQTHQMRVRGDKAMLTIVESSPEHKGEISCRAANSVGEATCKTSLEIIELTYEEKLQIDNERYAALQIQHAAEHMRLKELERREKINLEHKEALSKLKEDRKHRTVEKHRELDDSKTNIWKTQMKQKGEKVQKAEEINETVEVVHLKPKEHRIAQVYDGWKKPLELEEKYPELKPVEFTPNQVPGVKCFVKVSETSMKGEEVVREIAPQFFEDEEVVAEIAKVHSLLKQHVSINEIWSMFRAGEFKHLQQPKIQTALVKICQYIGHQRNVSMVLAEETQEQAQVHPVGLKALLRMVKYAKDIKPEVFFKEVIPREMGKFSPTTQELQQVSQMIKQGIENEEIIATCEAGKLPTLKKPETQQPLINIVEKQGHTVMVAQVLVEEAYKDAVEERSIPGSAWQLIHEEELAQAKANAVEPEPLEVQELKPVEPIQPKPAELIEVKEEAILEILEEKVLKIQEPKPSKETIPTDEAEPLETSELPETRKAQPKEEIGYKTHKATLTQVHSELCVPGFKALVHLATEGSVDLETIDLKPLEKKEFQEDIAKLSFHVKKGVQVNELMTMMKEDEFPSLKPAEAQPRVLDVVDKLEHATVTKVLVEEAEAQPEKKIGVKSIIKTVETGRQTMEEVIMDISKQFGPTSEPVKEIASVGQLLSEGVKCEEVISLLEAGHFPALQKEETQETLVSIVSDKGHAGTVCEVLLEESAEEFDKFKPKMESARLSEVTSMLEEATMKVVNVKNLPKVDVAAIASEKTILQTAVEYEVKVEEGLLVQEAQLQIVEENVEIAPPLGAKPGDQLRAIATYVVEDDHENAMHLIEGEKVYVQECSNSEWWYVEKHLTKERGFVPAKLLAEESSYNLFVQKRLEEKIQKLPVFEKLKRGEKGTEPRFIEKIEPKVVIDGQEVQFICQIDGIPRPTITWFRQTAIIKPSEEFQIFYSADGVATLIIKEVFPEDAGMFTCVAKNQMGAAACSAELVVEGPMSDHGSDSVIASRRSLSRESSVCDLLEGIPPTFAQKSITKTTEEGVTLELDVRLVAIPEPEITWKKDGEVIRDSNRIRIVKQKDVHAYVSLVIIKGTRKDDQGVYEVEAKNREGEARITITLTVTEPEGPEFIEKLSDVTVEEEGTIRLFARVRGNPIPDVTWSSTFSKGLESCVVQERSEVVLECKTTKEVQCQWIKDSHRVREEEDKITIEREGLIHRLIITSARVSDAGKYECIFDDETSTWCNVTVKGIEEFISRLEDLEVIERETAAFRVEVSKETLEVTWHKDGKEITSRNERFEIIKEDRIRKLILKSANLSDEGEYTCCLGDLECSAELGVREQPAEIVRKMQDQLVYRGAKAIFEVELTKGDAVITWYKNDEEIRFSDHYQLSIDGKVQRLLIYNCQMDDGGFYRAVVGKSECSAVLTVELQEEGDFIKKLQSELDVTSGSDVTFTVKITKPEFDVQWFRNGEEIVQSDRFVIEREEKKRSFTIKSTKKSDAADYTCILGKLKSTCKLNVIVLETPPTVDRSQIQVEFVVVKGHDVTIIVPFKATPTPTAKWTHRGKTLNTDTKKYLGTITENCASITIHQVENVDCGEYRLLLANNCGNVSIDFTLKILDKPSKPGWPEVLQVTNDSVTIHWREPTDDGGRTITNYVIEYRNKKSRKWDVFNLDFTISESNTVVTSLTTNEEYCFRVFAINEVGTSEASEESQFVKVCEPIRPEPPTILEDLQPVVTGLHQTVVLRCVISGTPVPTIEWTKDGQVISTYTTYENFTATYTIRETSGSSAGRYTCRATNEAGYTECSSSVVIQEAPRFDFDESLQAQMLYVGEKWHIPIQVTGYPQPKIRWTRNDESITSSHRVIIHTEEEEGVTDIAIQKLDIEDTAVFTLTAENSAGKATVSFNLRVAEEEKIEEEEVIIVEEEQIKLERPGPPTGPLLITEVTSESVHLTWEKSTFDGGSSITSYYIERLESGQKQWQKVDEVEAHITTYIVQNLNEGREYFFRIFALNAIGLSDSLEGESVFIKRPFEVPGPPLGPFDVGILTDSSLLLTWGEPEYDGGAPIIGYLVERREAFKKAWQKVGQTAAEVTKIEITGLKRGASYFFRVFAINEVGQGPPLQPEDAITAGKKITVPSMPTGLNVIDVTSRTVTLGWAPPATTGGADLIGYVIQSRLTSEDKWQNVRTVDPSITLFCIEHLIEKSEYEFRVYSENPVGLSEQAATTEYVRLKTHATPPSPPTAPLEARPTGPTSLMIEWGAPESDGGAPLLGYIIAIRDIKRTMWIEVGQVDANFTRLHIKELQENHEYNVRVFARNEVGTSDPLETEDPVQIVRPDDFTELPEEDAAPSLSYSTTETLSWMREAGVDADIYSYARGRLLNRDEYFFKVWHQTKKPFQEDK